VNHLDDSERERMEAELAKHYGEPVRPVSQYCNALRAWAKVCAEHPTDEHLQEAGRKLQECALPIAKSNLLWRMIYEGQKLRTKQCPKHKGRWSGYQTPPPEEWIPTDNPRHFTFKPVCECQNGYDVTGWLPEDDA
jgi:hypothetical protein